MPSISLPTPTEHYFKMRRACIYLAGTLDKVHFAEQAVNHARYALEQARNAVLLNHPDPKTLGANEAAREAALAAACRAEIDALREAETALEEAKLRREHGRLHVDYAKQVTRLLELAAAREEKE